MIDYMKPHPHGFYLVPVYHNHRVIASDFKQIKILSKSQPKKITPPDFIKTVRRNPPIFISQHLIFLTLPHAQTPFRYQVNLVEVYQVHYQENTCKVTFYSGNTLVMKGLKPQTFQRFKHHLKQIQNYLTGEI